jgi:hypothetical protein
MVPVLDMLDHRQEQQAGWHTGEAGQEPFQFVSLVPFAKVCVGCVVVAAVGGVGGGRVC